MVDLRSQTKGLTVMKGLVSGGVLAVVLAAALAFAQTPTQPPPAQPTPAKPPATGTAQPPAKPAIPAVPAAPTPPRPFPEGAKIAFVVLQRIANESTEGKAATTKIQALQQKKAAELNEKNKQLQGLQQKLEKEGSVLATTAQADIQKQIERIQVDIQRFTQDAQQEISELQNQLQQQFETRVQPVIAKIAEEKGLHYVFNGPDAALVWADPGLDISADVIKRLDGASQAPAKPPGQ